MEKHSFKSQVDRVEITPLQNFVSLFSMARPVLRRQKRLLGEDFAPQRKTPQALDNELGQSRLKMVTASRWCFSLVLEA